MRTLGILAGMAVLAVGTAQAGLLVNESFEAQAFGTTYGDSEGVVLTGWQFQPGPDAFGSVAVLTDPVTGKDGNNFAQVTFSVLQTAAPNRVAVTPGQNISLDVKFMAGGGTWDDTLLYVDFYNDATSWNYAPVSSSGAMHLPNANWGGNVTTQFNDFHWDVTVPDGVSYFGVRFNAPKIWQGPANIDSVVATVPEPASVGVIGGVLLMLARRHRKA